MKPPDHHAAPNGHAAIQAEAGAIPFGHITAEGIFDFVESFPALLWRVDVIKNQIEYLNRFKIPGLGDRCGLILQNMGFARQVVFKEDLHLLENFMTAVRNGDTAATVFRVRDEERLRWIKLTGTVYRKNPRFYIGYMLDCSDTAAIVQAITEKEAEFRAMIDLVGHPVLLVDPAGECVAEHNAAARKLFGYTPEEFGRLGFSGLTHKSAETLIQRIYEEVIFEGKWAGRLMFRRRSGAPFQGEVIIRRLYFEGRRLFRVSIGRVRADGNALAEFAPRGPGGARRAPPKAGRQEGALLEKIGGKSRMEDILAALLESPCAGTRLDAVIYSDVYARRNRVVVYAAGAPLASMPQGEVFPYEGTIAENIERYKLDHLIVDDTSASIKAIDWALFIPHGIRSYFAKPFYDRRVLRTVLILCATERGVFSEQMLDVYSLLYRPFPAGLKNWRNGFRKKKTG